MEALRATQPFVEQALTQLADLAAYHPQLAGAAASTLEDCILQIQATARLLPDSHTDQLLRLYEVQIILMK